MSCGVRTNLRTVRRATAIALGQNPAPALRWACTVPGGEMVVTDVSVIGFPFGSGGLGAGGVGRLAGEGEEHLVQRGPPQRDVLDRHADAVQGTHGLHQPAGPVLHRNRRPVHGEVGPGIAADGGQHRSHLRERRGVADVDLDHVIAGAGLQLRRCAGGDHRAVVDDDDVRREPIGLVEVLGGQQHIGAGGDELADRVPQLDAAAGVKARGRLVQQQQAGSPDQAGAQIQAAAHPAGVGADQPVGVLGELDLVQDRRGGRPRPAAVQPEQAADHLQVLAAGHGRFTAANWPARPITCRTCAGWRSALIPATCRVPASGRSRVATARTKVVLPAPLGPSRATTRPGLTTRSSPARAWVLPKRLVRPAASRIGVIGVLSWGDPTSAGGRRLLTVDPPTRVSPDATTGGAVTARRRDDNHRQMPRRRPGGRHDGSVRVSVLLPAPDAWASPTPRHAGLPPRPAGPSCPCCGRGSPERPVGLRDRTRRSHLRAVAYRMLGSLTEADDAVQGAWLRLSRSRTDTSEVHNLGGWLTTLVARECLDMLHARISRREEPLGVHLPDPIISPQDQTDPEQQALLAEGVGLALLVVLDKLAPAERLAFVLHDMFAVPFDQIGPIVGRSPDAAKMLASRARRRVQGAAPVPDADLARQREVVDAFFAAARDGDFAALVALLDPEVVVRADRAAPAGISVVRGAAAVAEQVLATGGFARLGLAQPALVNGAAGVVLAAEGRLFAVVGFTVRGGKIAEIDILADPARLRRLDLAVPDH